MDASCRQLWCNTPQWKRGVDSSNRCCRPASLSVAWLVRLAAACEGLTNMDATNYTSSGGQGDVARGGMRARTRTTCRVRRTIAANERREREQICSDPGSPYRDRDRPGERRFNRPAPAVSVVVVAMPDGGHRIEGVPSYVGKIVQEREHAMPTRTVVATEKRVCFFVQRYPE